MTTRFRIVPANAEVAAGPQGPEVSTTRLHGISTDQGSPPMGEIGTRIEPAAAP